MRGLDVDDEFVLGSGLDDWIPGYTSPLSHSPSFVVWWFRGFNLNAQESIFPSGRCSTVLTNKLSCDAYGLEGWRIIYNCMYMLICMSLSAACFKLEPFWLSLCDCSGFLSGGVSDLGFPCGRIGA